MEKFYSSGGCSNPDFRYKVRINRGDVSEMEEWCDDYPVQGPNDFQRYYIEWKNFPNVIFQFECEAPAIMFKLKFFHG